MPAKIAFILPLYGKFAFGRRAALSFFKYTPAELQPLLIVVDDASPQYDRQDWKAWREGFAADQVILQHFPRNAGLTRSWNWGLQYARDHGCEHTICGNSDVLFTPGWSDGLLWAVSRGYHLVGPVSNAPGVTAGGLQRVGRYYSGYQVVDRPDYLARVATSLAKQQRHKVVDCLINGFFMLASTDNWWEGAFDAQHVFDPSKPMVGNEDELQGRWVRAGRRIGCVPSSFIFHYRAVTRGSAFKREGWFRPSAISDEV